MHTFFSVPDPITPDWLTAVLRDAGVLRAGAVTSVTTEATGAFNSNTRRLVLDYSDDAPASSPAHLVVKQSIPEAWAQEAGIAEATFYQLVATLPDHPAVTVPCYAATYDERSGDSYLVLRDLTQTHRPPITREQQISIIEGVPRAEDIDAVVDTLARLHTYWWDHPELGTGRFEVGYWNRNVERFNEYLARRRTAWDQLAADERAWFPAELRSLYERVLDHLPVHWERYLRPRFQPPSKLTLVHGDSYFANFLCPRTPGAGATYLLDWQSPGVDIGGYDLANLCAAFWTSQQRNDQQREERMLRRYHTGLQAHGVTDYPWDELVTDYQTGLMFWVLMPIQDRYDGAPREYWWPKMQCVVAAFGEWHCETLFV